ncbi:MAG: ASKHA domain-containing protein [Nitrospirota bacterium]
MNHNPIAFPFNIKLTPPSPDDKTADAERLRNRLGEAGLNDVTIPLRVLRKLPEELRKNLFELELVIGITPQTASLSEKGGRDYAFKIMDICRKNIYGIAIDIGTTNIECSLFNLVTCEKADVLGIENPQMKYGSDVLTRVHRAMSGEFDILAEELLKGINIMIDRICVKNNILNEDIFASTVAGNTIMQHFFLGLDVRNIPVSPYIPAVSSEVFLSAEEAGMNINRDAVVYVFPNSGSYVGGDIISGMIFSGIYREKDPVLFIDVGTNVEITLGCRDWIMVGAGAAGPALEGGISSIGKKAEDGTIYGVKIDRSSKDIVDIKVISDIEPSGICGSGMIDLISEMFSANIIDQAGRFTDLGKGVMEKEGEKAYILYCSDKTKLFIKEREIQNFLLSKAAMFAFLYVFVKSVGLTFKDIKKVYIAGALGCGINIENAVNIGILPDLPRERFIPLGNSSLGGAEMALLDRNLLHEINGILPKITYREMNEDTDLMNALQGALFIPHTEPEILKG